MYYLPCLKIPLFHIIKERRLLNMNRNSIKQSIDTIPNTLVSYSGYCSKCSGGWYGTCYSTYGESYDEVKNHENTFHHDATVITNTGNC